MTRTRRLLLTAGAVWIAVVIVGIVIFALVPVPPGPGSDQSKSQSDTIRLLAWLAWPIFTLVITALIAAVLLGRSTADAPQTSPARLRGNPRIAVIWVAFTGLTVLSLAVFGTITLTNEEAAETLGLGGGAAGGGAVGGHLDGAPLEVQVIAQQWLFTYRYPSFGGMESAHLVLPIDAPIEMHITSLDVTHSFWFPGIGVKADAVPLKDNVFNVVPRQVGTYRIQCGELCGIWHGAMADNTAMLMTNTDFNRWAQQQSAADAPVMQYLPPYDHVYQPAPGAYGS
jgi:cytochrome c oxidase subunit 2